jgi:hypothetical protein
MDEMMRHREFSRRQFINMSLGMAAAASLTPYTSSQAGQPSTAPPKSGKMLQFYNDKAARTDQIN